MDASRTLFIVGSAPFILAGGGHALLALYDAVRPTFFTPVQKSVGEAMERATLAFYPSVKIFRAWIGFNISHGVGLLVFGLFVLLLATLDYETLREVEPLIPLSVGVGAAYLALSLRFWFWAPVVAMATGTACFVVGWALS